MRRGPKKNVAVVSRLNSHMLSSLQNLRTMNVDTLPTNSNEKSLPDCSAAQPPATIQKKPHQHGKDTQLPLATPSPDNNNDADMAPRPEASVVSRTVSLSPSEQSDESDTSDKSLVTVAPEKNDADAMDVTEDEQDDGASQVRRSKREKKSTLVYINGQAVLAKNNYQMKGLSYQYGTDFETAPPKAAKTNKTAKPKAPPKQRTVTKQETKRIAHNDAVKKRIESKKERRAEFLASNVATTLEPFLDKHIASQLLKATPKTTTSDKSQELFVQPEAIQADMRDYQLEGLNWMTKMHDANLAMILGDEMVRLESVYKDECYAITARLSHLAYYSILLLNLYRDWAKRCRLYLFFVT